MNKHTPRHLSLATGRSAANRVWRVTLLAVLFLLLASSGPRTVRAQEGSGPSGHQEGAGMVLDWSISGADVGQHFYADRTWQAKGTITSTTVRFSGKMRVAVEKGVYTDSSGMTAYISLPMGENTKEVKWSGPLDDQHGLSHELPFDLSIEVPPNTPVIMAASTNMVGGVADVLGVYFQMDPPPAGTIVSAPAAQNPPAETNPETDSSGWVVMVGGVLVGGALVGGVLVAGGLLLINRKGKGGKGAQQPTKTIYVLQVSTQQVEISIGQSVPVTFTTYKSNPAGGYVPAPEAIIQVALPTQEGGLKLSATSGTGNLYCMLSLPSANRCMEVTLTATASGGGSKVNTSVQVTIIPLYTLEMGLAVPIKPFVPRGEGIQAWARVVATPPDPQTPPEKLTAQVVFTTEGPNSDWIKPQPLQPFFKGNLQWVQLSAVPPQPNSSLLPGNPSLVARCQAGKQPLEQRLVLQMNENLVLDLWAQGQKEVDVECNDILDPAKGKGWNFGDIDVYFHSPQNVKEVAIPPNNYDLSQAQFQTEPPNLLDINNYRPTDPINPSHFTAQVSLRRGVDLTKVLGSNQEDSLKITLTISIKGGNNQPQQSSVTYTIVPIKVAFCVCSHDGALLKIDQHTYGGTIWEAFTGVADGEDKIPLTCFFLKRAPSETSAPDASPPVGFFQNYYWQIIHEDIVEGIDIEWIAQNTDDFNEIQPDTNNTHDGFISYWAQSARCIEAEPERGRFPERLVFEARLKPEAAKIYQIVNEKVDVDLHFQYPKLWLWVVPGQYRGTSEAIAYLEALPCHKPLDSRELKLEVINPAYSSLSLDGCEPIIKTYTVTQVGGKGADGFEYPHTIPIQNMVIGSAYWKLRYSGMTWENLNLARFFIKCNLLDQKGSPAITVIEVVNVYQNVQDLLGSITDNTSLRSRLDNPEFKNSQLPFPVRGPAWNFQMKFGDAPFVCSVMRDTLVEYMQARRSYRGSRGVQTDSNVLAAMNHIKTMNGIEFDKYAYIPIHAWAGIFLSGTERFGDYRILDPWWGQRWWDDWRKIENIPDKYYEEKMAMTAAKLFNRKNLAFIAGGAALTLPLVAYFAAFTAVAATGAEIASGYVADDNETDSNGAYPAYLRIWVSKIIEQLKNNEGE